MTEAQKKPPPNPRSRALVIVAVAVLIVVAIAGIVLAGRKPAEPAVSAAAPDLPAMPAASGSTLGGASAPTDGLLRAVRFGAGSDKLPANVNDGIARFAEAARSGASSVKLSASFYGGENKTRNQELTKARAGAIRHALEADGISAGRMNVELTEMPPGTLTDDDLNRVDLTLI